MSPVGYHLSRLTLTNATTSGTAIAATTRIVARVVEVSSSWSVSPSIGRSY
jgi:hypothetical protein